MDEISLFLRIRQGNVVAFEAFFRKYYRSMCAVALRFTGDEEFAEDIAQEAFIKLWEKREKYQSIPDLKTFLYVAVKNLSLNYIRDKKNTVDCSKIDLLSKDNFLRDQLIKEETYRMISQAIENLPAQSSRIMKLVLEGKQNQEIAEILGITVATVKTLKYHSLHILREELVKHLLILYFLCSK